MILTFAGWKKATSLGLSKPRSSALTALGKAFEKYEKTPSPSNIKEMETAFSAWKASKNDWRKSIRNSKMRCRNWKCT